MDPIQDAHVKLLAQDFLNLSVGLPFTTISGRKIVRSEAVGVVVSRERRRNLLRFLIDDGTGCIPCVLWLNHCRPLFPSPDAALLASAAEGHAARAQLGTIVRVRGRVSAFRGAVELTVGDVVAERDPNVEVLHWLQCLRLARCCNGLHVQPSVEFKKRKTCLGEG